MKRRFFLRTIKNGRVRIYGKWYIPSSQWLKYDGRFDDKRFAFGRYEGEDVVCLWGSEADFKNHNEDFTSDGATVVDGALPWCWWHPEAKPAKPN